jgi:hypothetical protein
MEEHQFQGEQFRDPVIRRQAACRCNGYRCTECMLLEIWRFQTCRSRG